MGARFVLEFWSSFLARYYMDFTPRYVHPLRPPPQQMTLTSSDMITRTFSDPHPAEMVVKDPALDQVGSAMQLEARDIKIDDENRER